MLKMYNVTKTNTQGFINFRIDSLGGAARILLFAPRLFQSVTA